MKKKVCLIISLGFIFAILPMGNVENVIASNDTSIISPMWDNTVEPKIILTNSGLNLNMTSTVRVKNK